MTWQQLRVKIGRGRGIVCVAVQLDGETSVGFFFRRASGSGVIRRLVGRFLPEVA